MRPPAVLATALAIAVAAPACGGDGDANGASLPPVPRAKVDRFSGAAAYASVKRQVELGPRPAGSPASRVLGDRIRRALPRGRFQAVPGGLRNVVGAVRGRERGRYIVVGAHYDTKDIPGFVGANDGASGTAVMIGLARRLKPRRLRPTVVFIAFDGEENPPGAPDSEFAQRALRGSKAAARRYSRAEAMVLLDFVGEKGLRLPREGLSDARLWARLRRAARRVGVGRVFPRAEQAPILDDHVPFLQQGVPSINLIDFDFDCWHRTCDDLSVISERSLDATGEAVTEFLRSYR